MRKYNGINRRGFLRSAMLSGAAMCVSSISNEMVANESRDKQEPLALGSKVAAGISCKTNLGKRYGFHGRIGYWLRLYGIELSSQPASRQEASNRFGT